jgi:serine protease DegQ
MNRLLGAVALGIALAGGNIAADASVRLPAEQIIGMPSLAPLLRHVTAAVVTVAITGHSGPEMNSSLNNGQRSRRSTYTRGIRAERQTNASGSGVVIDAQEGLIFTNSHVIDRAEEIIVTLPNGRELPAKRIGSDRVTDVAVTKVRAQNLTALPIGDSDALEVGDFVLAIGNPYQIGQTEARNTSELTNRMGLLSVGDAADLTVLRDGRPMIIPATIVTKETIIRSH